MRQAFAVWLTGLPASGKSAIARALFGELQARGMDAALLESDALRLLLTPRPRYDEAERDLFYAAMAHLGAFLVERGVPVIFDATAHRRAWRAAARERIARFAEVFVNCPLEVCERRDPKGLYRSARAGGTASLPGTQAGYEPPEHAELEVRSDVTSAQEAARRIVALCEDRGWM